jgi:hypothetical protein
VPSVNADLKSANWNCVVGDPYALSVGGIGYVKLFFVACALGWCGLWMLLCVKILVLMGSWG